MTSLTSFHDARRIAASAGPLASESRPLTDAVGCVLSEPVSAQLNIPHSATSAMDGWAVASAEPPWRLRPDGADRPSTVLAPLSPGEAVAVVTGSPVPDGAHSVLRSEHGSTHSDPGHGALLSSDPATTDLDTGRNIRPEAAEARAGQLLVDRGRVLTASRAAAAAVAGYDHLAVIRPPRVRLILTGGEVITAGLPGRGEVRDVFGLALPHMLKSMGADIASTHRLDDDAGALAELIEPRHTADEPLDPRAPDLVITTGGTAHSSADVLRPALAHIGAETLVESVNMRPGHPAVLARHGRTYVIGLPGNPLAGFAALAVLGEPLIRALRGLSPALTSYSVRAGCRLPGPKTGVRLIPVGLTDQRVHPLAHASAHMMRGLADAHALAVVPHGGIPLGGPVECLQVPGTSVALAGPTQEASQS